MWLTPKWPFSPDQFYMRCGYPNVSENATQGMKVAMLIHQAKESKETKIPQYRDIKRICAQWFQCLDYRKGKIVKMIGFLSSLSISCKPLYHYQPPNEVFHFRWDVHAPKFREDVLCMIVLNRFIYSPICWICRICAIGFRGSNPWIMR